MAVFCLVFGPPGLVFWFSYLFAPIFHLDLFVYFLLLLSGDVLMFPLSLIVIMFLISEVLFVLLFNNIIVLTSGCSIFTSISVLHVRLDVLSVLTICS